MADSDEGFPQSRPASEIAGFEGRSKGRQQQRPDSAFQTAIAAARRGSESALGAMFEGCRNYLLLIANEELGENIQGKIGASDLVQETFLQAQRIFARFNGNSSQELLAWLARILEFKLAQTTHRFVGTDMRDVSRELPLQFVDPLLVRDNRRPAGSSAESAIDQSEKCARIRLVLDRLPPDYRLAIELRNLQQRSFGELGKALNRSPSAARKVWIRALERLGSELRSDYGSQDRIDDVLRRLVDT
jgi:RNA polymerase sigma-70 factor, ECF subfamily